MCPTRPGVTQLRFSWKHHTHIRPHTTPPGIPYLQLHAACLSTVYGMSHTTAHFLDNLTSEYNFNWNYGRPSIDCVRLANLTDICLSIRKNGKLRGSYNHSFTIRPIPSTTTLIFTTTTYYFRTLSPGRVHVPVYNIRRTFQTSRPFDKLLCGHLHDHFPIPYCIFPAGITYPFTSTCVQFCLTWRPFAQTWFVSCTHGRHNFSPQSVCSLQALCCELHTADLCMDLPG